MVRFRLLKKTNKKGEICNEKIFDDFIGNVDACFKFGTLHWLRKQ
jgi:hypothetical protein